MKYKLLLFIFLSTLTVTAQTLTFDEFIKYSTDILDPVELQGIKKILPEKFVITGADFGDISGDTLNDFAIAVRPSIRRSKDIYVYIFVDSLKNYIPVFTDTLQFVELPIEIAFTISEKMCLITQKVREDSWTFRGFSFLHNELSTVDIYHTGEEVLDKKNRIGEETYENFVTMNAFNGYYNQNSLKDYKKNKFFNFPVYERRRNIYKNYSQSVYITSSWLWGDSTVKEVSYGKINFTRDENFLDVDISLNDKVFADSAANTIVTLYFDRSPLRLLQMSKKKEPLFRDTPDENIGSIKLNINYGNPAQSSLSSEFGNNFNQSSLNQIVLGGEKELISSTASIRIPMGIFNTDSSEIGIFISIEQKKGSDTILLLKNSDGNPDDPSSYGRLKFIGPEQYYGRIINNKFKELVDKLHKNSL